MSSQLHRLAIIGVALVAMLLTTLTPTTAEAATTWSGRLEAESVLRGTTVASPSASKLRAVRIKGPSSTPPVAPGPAELVIRARKGRVIVLQDNSVLAVERFGPTWGERRLEAVLTASPVTLVPFGSVEVDRLTRTAATVGYTTYGRKMLDPTGARWAPHGFHRAGFEWNPSGWWTSARELEPMRVWGADTIRLSVSQEFWLPTSCSYVPIYAPAIEWYVEQATQAGLYVIFDLHTRAVEPCGDPVLAPMADRASVAFWKDAAARFADNPMVGFDLWNEPHDISGAVWRDGGRVDGHELVGMQQLYDTVRATGADNLVFVSGTGWAASLDVALTHALDGWGIVYGVHAYHHGQPDLDPYLDRNVNAADAFFPVVVTEFGTDRADAAYLEAAIDWAESRGFGWLAYDWFAGTDSFALLNDWDTYMPNALGWTVYWSLQAHA